jgi:hypothetical protein
MGKPCTLEEARAAKTRAREMFRPLAEVVGLGITRIDGGYGVKVNLREGTPPDVAPPRERGRRPGSSRGSRPDPQALSGRGLASLPAGRSP